jgi:hypothetical protein
MINRIQGYGEVNGIPVWSVDLETGYDEVEVTTLRATMPDPAWEFRDSQGHYHAFTGDGKLPTLELRLKEHIPCHDYDECGCPGTDVMANYCRICGDEVEPQRIPDLDRKFIPGRSFWSARVSGAMLRQGSEVTLMFYGAGPDGVLPARQRVMFGIARVTDLILEMDQPARARLDGIGPLGER